MLLRENVSQQQRQLPIILMLVYKGWSADGLTTEIGSGKDKMDETEVR